MRNEPKLLHKILKRVQRYLFIRISDTKKLPAKLLLSFVAAFQYEGGLFFYKTGI